MPRRISILGAPGSGKSTLALRLGRDSGLPVYHLDQIHWMPGWAERERDEKALLLRDMLKKDRWILEGNYLSDLSEERIARSDLVIWLDLPVSLRLWRVTLRRLYWRGQTRPDMPENCPERFDRGMWEFYHFLWRTRHSARDRVTQALNGSSRVDHLTTARAARAYSIPSIE